MPPPLLTRRGALARLSNGFGLMALSTMLGRHSLLGASADAPGPRLTKAVARARSVIFCYMSGGVSHVDSFDPKPRLQAEAGQPMPMPVARTQFNNNGLIQPSAFAFKNYGQSGLPVSELFPHVGSCADDLLVIRSMTAKFSEHAQGNFFMHSGFPFMGYPSAGAWTSYGLGSENNELPGYVVLRSGDSGIPHGGLGLYSSAFLPAAHEASLLNATAPEALRNLKAQESPALQRGKLDFISEMDRSFSQQNQSDQHIEAAVRNYELAWKMQSAVPELCDISGETAVTRRLYGVDDADPRKSGYARQCLLARRLVERGVRFVELSCLSHNIGGGNGPNPWDQHGDLKNGHAKMAYQVDQPIVGLLKDLKGRGLLDTTLVIWAGEFGRTPFSQGTDGRDHNPYGFSIWMAGGGVKAGSVYGATDEYGYHAVEHAVTVYDLWANVLGLLGMDHEALTFLHGGRNLRLTDVHGSILPAWQA